MSTRTSAGVDDCPCFGNFFAMVPIDYKITIFLYTCLFTFLVTIIIFSELTSTTSKERMTINIYFRGCHTH